jgi:hypothetical protein
LRKLGRLTPNLPQSSGGTAMTASDVYWPYVAFAVGAVATLPFLYLLMNGAAPIRGALNPNYVGYGFGFVTADKDFGVTIAAGALILASAVAAWLAVRNRAGLSMLVVAAVCLFHVVNIGFPFADAIRSDPTQMRIQFGEYLAIPYAVAIPAIAALLILPFLLAVPWALRRAFEAE